MILGVNPPGGRADGWMGVEMGMGVCGSVPCTHSCTHMHTHARTHMHVKHVVNMINMDASMSAAICNFYTCINVLVCMCVHAHACACMHMHVRVWGDIPPCPQMPPTHLPPPKSRREPKIPKFNKS